MLPCVSFIWRCLKTYKSSLFTHTNKKDPLYNNTEHRCVCVSVWKKDIKQRLIQTNCIVMFFFQELCLYF